MIEGMDGITIGGMIIVLCIMLYLIGEEIAA